MSLRGNCEKRTLCEVLREINDATQGSALHPVVLPKLREAEKMAKKMAGKLVEYNKDIFSDWWAKNPDYEADIQKRLSQTYIT